MTVFSSTQRELIASVLLTNYNGKHFLTECLDSLQAQRTVYPFEVVLWDDHSTDGSVDFVREHFPWVSVITSERNTGPAEGHNIGARAAKGRYLIFADNDTVFDPHWLDSLVSLAKQEPKIGAIGSKIFHYEPRDVLQEVGLGADIFGFPVHYVEKGEEDLGQHRQVRDVFGGAACGLLVRREAFEQAGGFDGDYFIYNDDLDLCWRIHLAGYRVVVNPRAIMYHKAGSFSKGGPPSLSRTYETSVKRRYFGERNILTSLLKNYRFTTLLWILPGYLTILLAESLVYLVTGNFDAAKALFRAVYWNIRLYPRTLQKRRRVQKMRTVSDCSIMMRYMLFGSAKFNGILRYGFPKFRE
jgi:GT2 family glycosyltransferase